MSLDILLGLQWGDEGKGKIVDLLAPRYQVVARFQGGPNAGHTLYVNGEKHVLHTIPSGIVHNDIMNVIGAGMVIDPVILKQEIDNLQEAGLFNSDRLLVSKNAHLILPTHGALDEAQEKAKEEKQIGSTKKGIGPSYADKAGRIGFRIRDIEQNDFKQRVQALVESHIQQLPPQYQPGNDKVDEWFDAIQFLSELNLMETEQYLNEKLNQNTSILAEGAQGTLLDLDHGSYPFVTSSNTLAANACLSLGIAPSYVRNVYGVFKSYMTRVGSGPFPTELEGEMEAQLQHLGNEYGATTGRKRRCGWLDLPALRYAIQINGVNRLIVTKGDVLKNIDQPKYCHDFTDSDGNKISYPKILSTNSFSPSLKPLNHTPKQVSNNGDNKSDDWDAFKNELEHLTKTNVQILSVGPGRNDIVEFAP